LAVLDGFEAVGVVASMFARDAFGSGGELPAVVPAETEVDESPEVDRGGPDGECVPVGFDAAVTDSAVAVGDEPGDGAFDHRSVLPVVVESFPVTPGASGLREELVVVADVDHSAGLAGGAA
jgi:hypothetical protein